MTKRVGIFSLQTVARRSEVVRAGRRLERQVLVSAWAVASGVWRIWWGVVLGLGAMMVLSAQQPSLTWLGASFSGRWSKAYGVSADGRIVVGEAENAEGKRRAFACATWEVMRVLRIV